MFPHLARREAGRVAPSLLWPRERVQLQLWMRRWKGSEMVVEDLPEEIAAALFQYSRNWAMRKSAFVSHCPDETEQARIEERVRNEAEHSFPTASIERERVKQAEELFGGQVYGVPSMRFGAPKVSSLDDASKRARLPPKSLYASRRFSRGGEDGRAASTHRPCATQDALVPPATAELELSAPLTAAAFSSSSTIWMNRS